MAQNTTGTKYDHSSRRMATWTLVLVAAIIVFGDVLLLWDVHRGHPRPFVDFICLIPVLGIVMMLLRPRWQLTPDGLLDLRKETKTLYADMESVRVVKNRRNGAKVFAIQSVGYTDRITSCRGRHLPGNWRGRSESGKLWLRDI